jgi:hypothetical protein
MIDSTTHQGRVANWMQACFGEEISADIHESCLRFLRRQESYARHWGMPEENAHALVAHTRGRRQALPHKTRRRGRPAG